MFFSRAAPKSVTMPMQFYFGVALVFYNYHREKLFLIFLCVEENEIDPLSPFGKLNLWEMIFFRYVANFPKIH